MHLLPRTILNRVEEDCSIKELIGLHEAFVASNSANSPDMMDKSSTSLRSDFEAEMRELLEHFVAKGILTQDNKQMIRYSVRGAFLEGRPPYRPGFWGGCRGSGGLIGPLWRGGSGRRRSCTLQFGFGALMLWIYRYRTARS